MPGPSEVEKCFDIRRKLVGLDDERLDSLRMHLEGAIAEASWANKALEAAVLMERFRRRSAIDLGLYVRSFFTVEDVALWDEIPGGTPGIPSPMCSQSEIPANANVKQKILFLGSKFGDFVSSQEYVRGILLALRDQSLDFSLMSNKVINDFYLKNFDCYYFKTSSELSKVIKHECFTKICDLSGEYYGVVKSLECRPHLADPWGRTIPGYTADSAILWPENHKFNRFIGSGFNPHDSLYLYLTPESAVRAYPEITGRKKESDKQEIIFGAFCRTSKLNLRVITLWADLLRRVPISRLAFAFLQSNPTSERVVKAEFERQGIESDRVFFFPRYDTTSYLRLYNDVDVALGAMPEQGGVSCLDSLAMGCPYVVCEEYSHTFQASRILRHLGFSHWITRDAESYFALIKELAGEPALADRRSRQGLRELVLSSSLGDAECVSNVWRAFFLSSGYESL